MTGVSTNPNGEPRGLSTYVRILVAGEVSEFNVRGNFLRVADLSTPLPITLRSTQLGGHGIEFTNRMKKFEKIFSAMEYDSVLVDNDTDSNITVTLQLGYGDYEAEILSRTIAAPSFLTKTVYSPEGGTDIGDGGIFEVVLWPENLQRKRIVFSYNAIPSDGAVEIWFGPPGLATAAEVRAGALAVDSSDPISIGLFPVTPDGIQSTAAASLYLLNPDTGNPATVDWAWTSYEENYSAS